MHRINYGCYEHSIAIIDFLYSNICEKIFIFANQIEKDRYDRFFSAEPLITFAIEKNLYDHSIDYIYRHFVYDKLKQHGEFSDDLELYDMMGEFVVM
jgi:hypothetical protein